MSKKIIGVAAIVMFLIFTPIVVLATDTKEEQAQTQMQIIQTEEEKYIIYVKDLCQMIFKSLWTNRETGTYNAGTGIKTTMREQIEGIIKVFSNKDKMPKIIECPEKRDCDDFVMDIQNAKDDLGYKPQYDYIAYLEDYKREMELNRFIKK